MHTYKQWKRQLIFLMTLREQAYVYVCMYVYAFKHISMLLYIILFIELHRRTFVCMYVRTFTALHCKYEHVHHAGGLWTIGKHTLELLLQFNTLACSHSAFATIFRRRILPSFAVACVINYLEWMKKKANGTVAEVAADHTLSELLLFWMFNAHSTGYA